MKGIEYYFPGHLTASLPTSSDSLTPPIYEGVDEENGNYLCPTAFTS